MKSNHLRKLINGALFAALVCAATMVIQIPMPLRGYVNLGDGFVLLAGWLLGPAYGFYAAGIGAVLADLLTGYAHYAPATFLIKGAVAIIAAAVYASVAKALPKHPHAARLISAGAGEAFMVVGYFLYTSLLLGKGLAAAVMIPGDALQGLVAVVAAVLLIEAFDKTGLSKRYF